MICCMKNNNYTYTHIQKGGKKAQKKIKKNVYFNSVYGNAVESSVIGLQRFEHWIIIIKSLDSFEICACCIWKRANQQQQRRYEEKRREKKPFQTNMQSIYLCRLLPHCLYVSCGEYDLFRIYLCAAPI